MKNPNQARNRAITARYRTLNTTRTQYQAITGHDMLVNLFKEDFLLAQYVCQQLTGSPTLPSYVDFADSHSTYDGLSLVWHISSPDGTRWYRPQVIVLPSGDVTYRFQGNPPNPLHKAQWRKIFLQCLQPPSYLEPHAYTQGSLHLFQWIATQRNITLPPPRNNLLDNFSLGKV